MEFDGYRAKRSQVVKVRFLQVLLTAFGAWFIVWGYELTQTLGLRAADGGVLRPALERYAFGGFMMLMGLAVILGMLIYVRLYVLRIEKRSDGFSLTTLGVFWPRTQSFPAQRFHLKYHEGRGDYVRMNAGSLRVNAPWWSLRIDGHRLPYIIDAKQ